MCKLSLLVTKNALNTGFARCLFITGLSASLSSPTSSVLDEPKAFAPFRDCQLRFARFLLKWGFTQSPRDSRLHFVSSTSPNRLIYPKPSGLSASLCFADFLGFGLTQSLCTISGLPTSLRSLSSPNGGLTQSPCIGYAAARFLHLLT